VIENIGARVRTIRKEKNATLTELADQTGLSPAYISNLERGLCSPTLENMQRICSALGVEIVKLLDDREWAEKVIRADEREVIFEQKGRIRYEAINFGAGRMTGEYIIVEPHCEYEKEWTHSYDEIGLVLSGELTIMIDEKRYTLYEGDSFYIDSMKKHNLSNLSELPCSSLWIKQASDTRD
jgi:transcriptional regulator with XRE-family HTH domain